MMTVEEWEAAATAATSGSGLAALTALLSAAPAGVSPVLVSKICQLIAGEEFDDMVKLWMQILSEKRKNLSRNKIMLEEAAELVKEAETWLSEVEKSLTLSSVTGILVLPHPQTGVTMELHPSAAVFETISGVLGELKQHHVDPLKKEVDGGDVLPPPSQPSSPSSDSKPLTKRGTP